MTREEAERALADRVKEIIAAGCSCDRHCEELGTADVYCGCLDDAHKVINLVRSHDNWNA